MSFNLIHAQIDKASCIARLTLPRMTFLLSPVRGVPRDRLPEAVKSAIRFVRPADLQLCAADHCFA